MGNYKFMGFTDNYSKSPLPEPFEKVTKKQMTIEYDGNMILASLVKPLIKASLIYAEGLLQLEGKSLNCNVDITGFALGSSLSHNGERIFVEKYSANRKVTDLISYDTATGNIQGSFYDDVSKRNSEYLIKGRGGTDGTAIFLALYQVMLADPLFKSFFDDFLSQITSGSISEALDSLCKMSHFAYQALERQHSIPLTLDPDASKLPLLSKMAIDSGKVGPATGKTIMGTFHIMPEARPQEEYTAKALTIEDDAYALPFVHSDLSDEELLLVPKIAKDHEITEEEIFVLNEMKSTWDNPAATKITQIFAEGATSSGKSHLARSIAARLKRPYVSFTFSPNTDESDIKGMLLPVVKDVDSLDLSESDKELMKKLSNVNDDEINAVVIEHLGLPELTEIYYDPVGAYEQLTGIINNEARTEDCYTLLCQNVSAKIKSLIGSMDVSDGVNYRYIPSTIVEAIQKGWFIELQEPSCLLQQGMLSCLFDVLEKDSFGTLQTHNGLIKRHPDFLCMITTNREYKGTKPLNEAARGRFQLFLKMDTPSIPTIMRRIKKKVGIEDEAVLQIIAETYKEIDDASIRMHTNGAASLRLLYQFADAVKRKVNIESAINHYLLWPITTNEEELEELLDVLNGSPVWNL